MTQHLLSSAAWACKSAMGLAAASVLASSAKAGFRAETLPPRSAAQLQSDAQRWGQWLPFDEQVVHLDGLLSGKVHYHLLSKRPGSLPNTGKPLVLFLHGFPEFAHSWETWLDLIGAEQDAVAIDLKGYGESSKPVEPSAYNLYRLVYELNAVVSGLGYSQVIPVGHDWGGTFAWMYGMLMPQKVKAAVVLSTPHPYTFFRELANPNSEQRRRSQYIRLIRQNTPEATAQAQALLNEKVTDFPTPFYSGPRWQRLQDTNMATPADWDRMFSLYRAMDLPASPNFYTDPPNWLGTLAMTVRAPVLAYYGVDDPVFTRASWRGVEAFAPHLELRPLPGQGHFINHSVPSMPQEVLAFIKAHSQR